MGQPRCCDLLEYGDDRAADGGLDVLYGIARRLHAQTDIVIYQLLLNTAG